MQIEYKSYFPNNMETNNKPSKIAYVEEPSNSETIDNKFIMELIGNELIDYRKLYYTEYKTENK